MPSDKRPILLDTHFVLWLRAAPNVLTPTERQVIDQATILYVSAVSLWEMAILTGLGRIGNDPRLFSIPSWFDLLPVTPPHFLELVNLPSHHRDPFDRMLIAQARIDDLTLLTRDEKILRYGADGARCADI